MGYKLIMRTDLLPTDLEGKIYKVVEEAGEVLQVAGKIGRHGPRPTDPKTGIAYDNIKDLYNELTDLDDSIQRLMYHLEVDNAYLFE